MKMMTAEQLKALKLLAKSLDYGSGSEHSKQVKRLSLKIYRELVRLNLLVDTKNDHKILTSSALLHNIGLPARRHNEAAFDILENEIPRTLASDPLSPDDLSAILYCILWHRGNSFSRRHDIGISNLPHVSKLAGIVRIADALDRSFQQVVEDVILDSTDNSLEFTLKSKYPVDAERERAREKAGLFIEAFKLKDVIFH
jgi:exopolyphosphatase/guanosine-5'-triphosphate,3'-diphosphate pyrophosphatase